MTRLYKKLLVRLMPEELLDAINDLYEEQVERLQTEPRTLAYSNLLTPQEYAVEVVGELLDTARNAGWRPFSEELTECFGVATDYDQ